MKSPLLLALFPLAFPVCLKPDLPSFPSFFSLLSLFPVMPSFTVAPASAPTSASASASAFFTVKASELLSACKAAEAFRKGASALRGFRSYGLDADSLFFSSTGTGLIVEGFCWREAFALWLPSGKLSDCGGFSIPFASLFPFVKATKGKGFLSFEQGKLSASDSGASLTVEAGPSLFDSEAAESQKMLKGSHYLASLLSSDLTEAQKGFPLAPFLFVAPFCSDDASKLALCGAGFSGGAFFATDGFSLRKQEASLPGFPKASAGMPENAWLPSWLASCVNALTKASEREALLAFHWPERMECEALRFWLPSGLCAAFRFSKAGSFPNCQQLIPDRLPFAFACNRKPFLSAVEALLSALKASDGAPLVELSFQLGGFSSDGPGEVALSVTLQKNKGSKNKPELSDVGSQEASVSCSFTACAADPAFQEGFFDLPESQREMAKAKYQHESRILCNAFFLQRALKSFAGNGDRLLFQWKDERSPFLLSCFSPDDLCLIMPVQKRR
jgi:hypothetical protein